MADCTIPALLAAIRLLTQEPSNVILTVITPCNINPGSSACYEWRATLARAEEEEYQRVVIDVVEACKVLEEK